jgi:glycosyltransferase involved in cell wall biosynthesis
LSKEFFPLVTIAIATFNGEGTIEKCLESAIKQTYPRIEVIISDDSSTDSTAEICMKYAVRARQIKYHKNQVRLGIMHNYNSLLALAQGEFFILFDQDDFRDLDFIEKAVIEMSNPKVEIAMGRVSVIFNGKTMHINTFKRTAVSGSCMRRIYRLLRRPSDFLLYGLIRTESLRKVDGWTLGTSSFYRLVFALCLRGEIRTIDSTYYYSAKGFQARPSKREELVRNGNSLIINSRLLLGFLEIPLAYFQEIKRAELKLITKICSIFLVILDTLIKTGIKIVLRILSMLRLAHYLSRFEKWLIFIYHPIDDIQFLADRKDESLNYYRKNWPLV